MKPPIPPPAPTPIHPAVHLEFIQNQAGLPEEIGLEQIESYHRALFLHHHAAEWEQCQQQARTHEERLTHLESRLAGTHQKLAGLDSVLPVQWEGRADVEPSVPWNLWDRIMFVAATLGIALLLVFGVLNVSFNLLESGLVTFVESPIRAYFWAALLPVGALAVKIGWDLLPGRRLRLLYFWSCLALGLAGVLAWLGAYATVYPSLSQSTAEQLQTLTVQGNGPVGVTVHGVKWIDALIVIAQATAEIFLSAALGIYLTTLYLRHRPVRLAGNPVFAQLEEERRQLSEQVESERKGLAEARGTFHRLQNQLEAMLSFARSLYQKEAHLRRDQSHQKRLLLDEISERLRSQLERVQDGSDLGTIPPPLQRNGR
ncbi:MAG: hypothetical protein J0M24_00800 [Verrucomicrobia bacterium]|nr:hypothetical protein [Verrucomicrobiota bacterium]